MHDMLCEMYTELFFMVSVFVGEKIVHVSEREGINRELNCYNFSDLPSFVTLFILYLYNSFFFTENKIHCLQMGWVYERKQIPSLSILYSQTHF